MVDVNYNVEFIVYGESFDDDAIIDIASGFLSDVGPMMDGGYNGFVSTDNPRKIHNEMFAELSEYAPGIHLETHWNAIVPSFDFEDKEEV